ncbi:ras guanine nucleotide exchange factor domain-containing protein [Dichotomocladium elegans]|nr:ras guanine nucleotide exchange factor domain-containing protein [Dichotomocladium elegans]
MSSNEVICRVYALYPYISTDISSLSFEQGAVIDVLAQLDSGWWDGWCNGKRGWFPSNYVQIIEIMDRNDSLPQDSQQHLDSQPWSPQRQSRAIETSQRQLRLSLATSDPPASNPDQRSDWILQTTEDGSEMYYYNVVTKEMRYSLPPEDPINYNNNGPQAYDGAPTATTATTENGRYTEYGYSDPEELRDRDGRPVRPVRAANRVDLMHHPTDSQSLLSNGTTLSTSTSSPSVRTAKSGTDDQLPPNWVRKWTPKGREYFCNLLTEETTWTLDHIDANSGQVSDPVSPPSQLGSNDLRLSLATMGAGTAVDTPLSWSQLSALIAQAIRTLKESTKEGQIELLREDAITVVQHIRVMLYVSNSIDKDSSPHLKDNKQLKNYHRALLAALAKLVLSAKAASGIWAHQETFNKLQVDADDVLVAVRNFMTAAQEMRIEIQDSKPKLLADSPSTARRHTTPNGMESRPDALTTMVVLADNVHGAISSFMDSAREAFSLADDATVLAKIQSSTPLLVAQFRNLSNTTSQFLNSVEDIDTGHMPTRFMASKQAIHNAMGSLFIASQGITNQEISAEQILITFERIEACSKTIDAAVQDICNLSRQSSMEPPILSNPMPLFPDPAGAGRRPSHDYIRHNNSNTPPRTSRLQDIDEERGIHESIPGPAGFDRREPITDDFMAQSRMHQQDGLSRRRDTVTSGPAMTSPNAVSPGSTAPGNHYSDQTDYLGSDYDPEEIVFNQEGHVKGGTLRALVQRLTQHDQLDSKFITTFLLTYRSFCTTQELFEELFMRYTLGPPPNLTAEELELWQEKKLKLVRLRVFNVIKSWLEKYYNEEEDRPILPTLMQFTESIVRESMQFGADQLIKLIGKRMESEESGQIRKMTLNVRPQDMPPSILPRNMRRLRFLDIDPLELARQLTIMDFKLYSRIKPVECLDKNWGKGDSEHIAANVKASIEYSNQVTAWVTDSILSKDEVKKRAAAVKHWVHVAERCRLLKNYNTCMAILSAFDNSSIGRMKRTWELISARTMQTLTGIRRLMGANKNFNEYRDIIHKVNPPCIPFLGIYLQDLTFIEDGNSNFLKKSEHLINFAKRSKTAEVIRELQQYQSTPYLLQAVPDIQAFIKTHLQSSRDEETLYNLSLTLEPRERDEDTIARRLKESGL